MDNLLKKIVSIENLLTKLDLGPDSVLTIQSGIIVDTQDDLQLGRVKVRLDSRGNNSTRWSYFLGYPSGQIPPEYVRIGARVACVALYGNSNEMLILGTFGSDSLPNPISIPALSIDSQTPLPACNEKSIGHVHLLENKNGSDVNICVRSGGSYIWRKMYSSLITENQGLTAEQQKSFANLQVPSPSVLANDDIQAFSALPVCDQSKQGQIIPFSERDEWRQFNVICSKDENGDFTWKPSSTIPVFSRNNIPNPDEKYHGTIIQIDDGANSYLAYCARENGTMKWMKYTGREPIKFNNTTQNDRSNSKNKATPNVVNNTKDSSSQAQSTTTPAEIKVSQEGALSTIQGVIQDSTQGDPNNKLKNTTQALLDQASKATGTSIIPSQLNQAISAGTSIAKVAGIDIPSGIPTQIGNVLSSTDPLGQVVKATGSIISSYGDPKVSSVLYGVASGGWQGGLDAAIGAGLNVLPSEFRNSFSQYVDKLGGIDKLPGPLKDVANSALGNINVGLKDVAKYILNGSLATNLSNINFDLSKLNLSINPDEIGNYLKSILPGNIDLTNLKLDAGTLSKSLSGVLSYAGLGNEFSSLFGSNGLGTELANAILGGVAGVLTKKDTDPCSCNSRKCNIFKDPAKDGQSLLEDCKVVMCGQTTYNLTSSLSDINISKISEGFGNFNTKLGEDILKPENLSFLPSGNEWADLTKMIPSSRVEDFQNFETWISCADEPDKTKERAYNNETISKAFKVADNNITQLELTDKQVIDGILAIIKEIFGCGNNNGGIFGTLNQSLQNISTSIRELYSYIETLDGVKQGGSANPIDTNALQRVNEIAIGINNISKLTSSIACQIKADFIQPAKNINTALTPGLPAGSFSTPFKQSDLKTQSNIDTISKQKLIESVFDGIPDPKVYALPNRVSTLSPYPNKDKVDSILNNVFNDPNGTPQVFDLPSGPVDNSDLINKGLEPPNEENGRFAGEKDCR